ncbi:hypothetical protein ETI08_03540 [Macrococcoides goetzii]|nr:hypothetical protein [Macrococcus goetzii]TDM48224.1 hypothetical protein ETI08_03540 [Macrococcus goetzii]
MKVKKQYLLIKLVNGEEIEVKQGMTQNSLESIYDDFTGDNKFVVICWWDGINNELQRINIDHIMYMNFIYDADTGYEYTWDD